MVRIAVARVHVVRTAQHQLRYIGCTCEILGVLCVFFEREIQPGCITPAKQCRSVKGCCRLQRGRGTVSTAEAIVGNFGEQISASGH